jgi:hypothetical protein
MPILRNLANAGHNGRHWSGTLKAHDAVICSTEASHISTTSQPIIPTKSKLHRYGEEGGLEGYGYLKFVEWIDWVTSLCGEGGGGFVHTLIFSKQ